MTDVEILRAGHMKVDDTLPDLRVKLTEDGNPFNLNGFDVTMKMRRTDGDSLVVDSSATVATQSRGIVEYDWSAGDTDEQGVYEVEFIADDGTDVVTFPNRGYAVLHIEEGL